MRGTTLDEFTGLRRVMQNVTEAFMLLLNAIYEGPYQFQEHQAGVLRKEQEKIGVVEAKFIAALEYTSDKLSSPDQKIDDSVQWLQV